MKKWKQALALVLALVMALSLVALPSFAADEDSTTGGAFGAFEVLEQGGSTATTGLQMSKTFELGADGHSGILTLEAFATGTTQTITSTKPVDIVLVLDVSGSMDDPISSGDTTKKIVALQNAVNSFIDTVADKCKDSNEKSNIAIVKFSGKKTENIGNDTYRSGGYTYNYTQTVQSLTSVDTNGANILKSKVNALKPNGCTRSDYGMQLARDILKNDSSKNPKVVIMFTDGTPSTLTAFDKEVANGAISASKSIKDTGATVYTIGCFGSQSNNKVGTYMNYVSSNYPHATDMNNGGTNAASSYYKTVSNASDLDNIFQQISSTIGSPETTLGVSAVLRDVISPAFKLPDGAGESDITVYSVDCTEKKTDGTYVWKDTSNNDGGQYQVTINGKTIDVTGFDYSGNWVDQYGVDGSQSHGKKLVVKIPITAETSAYGDVPTNGDASGIYPSADAQDSAANFQVPMVRIPYFTVAHVESKVDENGNNYGKENDLRKNYPLWCNRPFNIVDETTDNYLYGGTFDKNEDGTYTKIHQDIQGNNPMSFTPTENATYYIWEVPNTYLTPRNYNVWRHLPENGGKETVVRLYPLTTADRTLYKQVGFVIDDKDYVSGCGEFGTAISNAAPTLYQTAVATKNGQHYETLYLSKGAIKASSTAIDESGLVSGQHIDDGCLAGIRLNDNGMAKFQSNSGVTFRPYWITLDNVKVYGATARTCTYVANSTTAKVTNANNPLPCEYVGDTVATQAMSFAKSFTMDDSQPVVDESLTVTVVDGSNTTQVKVAPNGSVRDQVAYQAPAGKVFAGWFADQAYTIPADLDQVTEDTTIYAKYVSDSYLDLHYVRNGLFRLRGVTLISAVDNPANYQESGIIVDGVKVPVAYANRYRLFYTASGLFGAARNAKLMITQQSLSGSGTLEVTPYWVTLDGTQVLGQTHTLHYNTRTIWE